MGYWAVELAGYDPAGAAAVTWRFALGRGHAPTDATYVPMGLSRWSSPSQKIDVGPDGVVKSTADAGELIIANQARGPLTAADWDLGVTYAWQDRKASLYWVAGETWASKVLVAQALLEQPVADLATLRFPLRDPRAALDAPIQTKLYAGDNVAPDGIEGTEDLKGKPQPLIVGVVSNETPDLVNEQKLIYRLASNAVSPLCVRDGGVPLTASTLRANAASLQANAPPEGSYDYVSNSTDGTLIRLGRTPVYGIQFDAEEGATEADRTHAQVWSRVRTTWCGTDPGDIDGASVAAVDALDPNEVGFIWRDQSRRDALDQILGSLVGYEVQGLDGKWAIGRLAAPSGTPAINLVQALAVDVQGVDDRPLVSLDRTRPGWEPNGSPPYRVDVQWGHNGTVMARSDFAGAASERLKTKFSTEWRVESAADTAIWDPASNGGYFPGAPKLTISTGYQPGADNRTCPHAAARAPELLTLFSGLKGQYLAKFLPEGPWSTPGADPDAILPGTVVSMTFARFHMDASPLFLVLASGWVVQDGRDPEANLTIGLQT